MSTTAPSAPPAPAPAPQSGTPSKKGNGFAIAALVLGIVALIFAWIPIIHIVALILAGIGLILAVVGLVLKGRTKGLAIVATSITAVALVASIAMTAFYVSLGNAVSDTAATTPAATAPAAPDQAADEPAADEPAADVTPEGTREDPYAIGTTIHGSDWDVTINSVTLNANDAVAAENPYNDPAAAGHQYMMVNATVTYTGEGSSYPAMVSIKYVTTDGVTVDSYDAAVLVPDDLASATELYKGGSVTGNVVFQVPSDTAGSGVISVSPGVLAKTVFVAVS